MGLASDFTANYGAADYKRDCRALAAYGRWVGQWVDRNGGIEIPAGRKPRGIAAGVDNAMRSRVDRYSLFTNPPSEFVGYIGASAPNGVGVDRQVGRTYPLIVWGGESIGYATLGKPYQTGGVTLHRIYAWLRGTDGIEREYTGVGQGIGMAVRLRETAASKRKRA